MPESLERYFRESRPEAIDYEDLERFLEQGIEENQTLEYKPRGLLVNADDSIRQPSERNQIAGWLALAKVVVGFANAEGGLLVLGVVERKRRYKGNVVSIRPGEIRPLPPSVTREDIEIHLMADIQYPIEGMTVVPVRLPVSDHAVYLIDVPQSARLLSA